MIGGILGPSKRIFKRLQRRERLSLWRAKREDIRNRLIIFLGSPPQQTWLDYARKKNE